MKNINWHSVRIYGMVAIAFVVAGLQAIHGMTKFDAIIDAIVPVLIGLEHSTGGNTDSQV